MNTLEVTRDEVMASRAQGLAGRYSVLAQFEGGEQYLDLLSMKEGYGFAVSPRTNLLFLVVQTGNAVRSNMVRVQLVPAQDTGDLAGTLLFDPAYVKVPGRMSADLAAQV
jgi:hypothetical protein